MKAIALLVSSLVVLVLSTSANAFDGKRQGFVMGLGGGFGALNFRQEVSSYRASGSATEQHTPLVTNFKIGGAPNDQLLLYYSSKVSWFDMENSSHSTVTITAGTATFAFSYFWLPTSPSWYVTGGLGMSSWSAPFEEDSEAWTGAGMFAGGGYEFSPHWSVEGGVNWGNPSTTESGYEFKTTHTTMFVTINGLAY